MGAYTIKPLTQVLAWLIATILVYLNVRMVWGQASAFFAESESIFWKSVIILAGLLFIILLLVSIIYPLVKKKKKEVSLQVHSENELSFNNIQSPSYNRIAIALDFSSRDPRLISHAMGQSKENTCLILIHIVESVSAKILGTQSDDFETRKDQQKLDDYVQWLRNEGIVAESRLGFGRRTKEIARLVKECNADLLIIGAHGHSGIKDWLYGATIDEVRHQLSIPVLIVSS
jgi:manganese transport protein